MTTTETVGTLAAARRDSAARTGEILSPRMVVHLDGAWGFVPYDVTLDALSAHEAQTILVPGLWEAQAWLELDGPSWYVRDIEVHPGGGCWTLRFGAVMDDAQVYLNGQLVGSHVGGYTPFAFDVTNVLVPGRNELAVRVVDPPAHSVDYLRSAHGKQGWKNDIFPSPPSLYLSYGGIWQSVTLTRHDEITVEDVFVNGDPCDGMARIRVRNRGASVAAVIDCVVGGQVTRANVNLEAASGHVGERKGREHPERRMGQLEQGDGREQAQEPHRQAVGGDPPGPEGRVPLRRVRPDAGCRGHQRILEGRNQLDHRQVDQRRIGRGRESLARILI